DCHFGPIDELDPLARALEGRAGIVEHGLFLHMATDLVVAGADGVRYTARPFLEVMLDKETRRQGDKETRRQE
ncbi:MAG: ribose-5-phosphate isomerase A, partial [Caldilinea sp.]